MAGLETGSYRTPHHHLSDNTELYLLISNYFLELVLGYFINNQNKTGIFQATGILFSTLKPTPDLIPHN